ncbi:MAG: EAL domain-containing protein [Ruminococcus sp.]|nr:EAL domain-containing protein [Ruminococcus sp.]
MRNNISVIYIILICALTVCVISAKRSKQRISNAVMMLCASLLIPVIGNFIIIISETKPYAKLGYYLYFMGVDFLIVALMYFAKVYCRTGEVKHKEPKFLYVLFAADVIQIMINYFAGHVFALEKLEVSGLDYYNFTPRLGLTLHRILVYAVLACIIAIFAVMTVKMPRVYRGRYAIILVTMLIVALWQTFYVVARIPVNTSMIGYGFFGICIFYFSLIYRPHRLLDSMLTDIVSDMPEALFVFDPNKKCLWANEEGIRVTGVDIQEFELVNERLRETFGSLDSDNTYKQNRIIVADGNTFYYNIETRVVRDESDVLTGYVLSIRDTTEEQLRMKRDIYNAIHDSLTGLYTCEYLYERISERLASNVSEKYSLVFLEIKNFKIVNDLFGKSFGDYALKEVADWIRANANGKCLYGRLAGVNFGILIPRSDYSVKEIDNMLSQFVVSDGNFDYHLLIHLGVYKVTDEDSDVQVMFDRAQLSLSTIVDEYKTHVAFYNEELRRKMLWDQHISAQLVEAISERQLCPYLQPIVDTSGRVVGAEALVRWINPVDGFMPPGKFIPVFEKNGMIVEVDRYMWRCACEILARWKASGIDKFISVNISPKDFYIIDVRSELNALVSEYGVDPAKLRIEITETVVMNDAEDRMKVLSDLRAAGFIVEMDDFGSGYSSLNMLKDMPVDVLKIDMKFLSSTEDEVRSQKIIRNIIRLSNDLDIMSLTEGVETEAQFRMLSEMNCNMFQGYYFSQPIPVEEFEEYLKKNG